MEPPLMVDLNQKWDEQLSPYVEMEVEVKVKAKDSDFDKTTESLENREASILNSEAVDLEIGSLSLLALGTLQVSESGIGRKPCSNIQDDPALKGGIEINLRVSEEVAKPSSPQQQASLLPMPSVLPTLKSCCDGCATLHLELETTKRCIIILEEKQQHTSRIAKVAARKLDTATALVGAAGRKLDAIEALTARIRLQENQHQDTASVKLARQLEVVIKRINTLERQHQQRTDAGAALAAPRVLQTASIIKSGQLGHPGRISLQAAEANKILEAPITRSHSTRKRNGIKLFGSFEEIKGKLTASTSFVSVKEQHTHPQRERRQPQFYRPLVEPKRSRRPRTVEGAALVHAWNCESVYPRLSQIESYVSSEEGAGPLQRSGKELTHNEGGSQQNSLDMTAPAQETVLVPVKMEPFCEEGPSECSAFPRVFAAHLERSKSGFRM